MGWKNIKIEPWRKIFKAPFAIYLDLECLLKNYNIVKTTPKNVTQKKTLEENYEEKEMIPLTKEENKSYKEQDKSHTREEKLCTDKDDENYKNRNCHYKGKFRGAAHSKFNLNYKVPKDIPIIIHNASYDTHFIINQLAEEFKGELNCIGENMETYITFSVPIKKKCEDGKTIT